MPTSDVRPLVRWLAWLLLGFVVACAATGAPDAAPQEAEQTAPRSARLEWHVPEVELGSPVVLVRGDGTPVAPLYYVTKIAIEDPALVIRTTLSFPKAPAADGSARLELRPPTRSVLQEVSTGFQGGTVQVGSARPDADGVHRVSLPAIDAGDPTTIFVRWERPLEAHGIEVDLPVAGLPRLDVFAAMANVIHDAGTVMAAGTVDERGYEPSADLRLVVGPSEASAVGLRDRSWALARATASFHAEASEFEGLTILWDSSLSAAAGGLDEVNHLVAIVNALVDTRGDFPVELVAFADDARELGRGKASDFFVWGWRELTLAPLGGTSNLERGLAHLARYESQPRVLLVSDGHVTEGLRDPKRLAGIASELRDVGARRIDVLSPSDRRDRAVLDAVTAPPGLTPGMMLDPNDSVASNLFALTRVPLVNVPVSVDGVTSVYPPVVSRLLPGDAVVFFADGVTGDALQVDLGPAGQRDVSLRSGETRLDDRDEVLRARHAADAHLGGLGRQGDVPAGLITWQTLSVPPTDEAAPKRGVEGLLWVGNDSRGQAAARSYGSLVELLPDEPRAKRWAAAGLLRLDQAHRSRARPLLAQAHAAQPGSFPGARLLAWATAQTDPAAAFELMVTARERLIRDWPDRADALELAELDLSVLAAHWWARVPTEHEAIAARLRATAVTRATEPMSLAVMSWEGDDVDADLHVVPQGAPLTGGRERDGGEGLLGSSPGGALPEAYLHRGPANRNHVAVVCRDPGSIGFCGGSVQLVLFDGRLAKTRYLGFTVKLQPGQQRPQRVGRLAE